MPDGWNGPLSLCHQALSASPENLALRQIGGEAAPAGAGTSPPVPVRGSSLSREPEPSGE